MPSSIHLVKRDRNVIVADCHIYNNTGAGIFLDAVNLHQTNIHGNHISYCKQRGGISVIRFTPRVGAAGAAAPA
jgi:hypothetical protein